MAATANEPARSGLRSFLSADTTPDRLRLGALAAVAVMIATGALAWQLTDRLVAQTQEVSESTGEVLVAAQQLSASFAEADAAAVSVHLAGADGNREQRRLYEQATNRATTSLERIARLVGDDERSHDALQDIGQETTEYVGLIEAARLASVEELSGADATLRVATAVNRNRISPSVDLISQRAAARFDDQTSSDWYVVAFVVLAVALVVLVVSQIMLARRFRRFVNVPLLLASLVVIGLLGFGLRGFLAQQSALDRADTQAFQAIEISEQLQQAAFLHRALATSAVLDGQDATELDAIEAEIEDNLLPATRSAASNPVEEAGAELVEARWERYQQASLESRTALTEGDDTAAAAIIQGPANSAFNGFNTTVEAALLDNREQFLSELDTAADSLAWMRGLILVGSLLAAVLAWWGFSLRIGEYR